MHRSLLNVFSSLACTVAVVCLGACSPRTSAVSTPQPPTPSAPAEAQLPASVELATADPTNVYRLSEAQENMIDSLLGVMTLEEQVGQLSLFTSDWDVTGPTLREGYRDDVRAGRVGAIFNAHTAAYNRELQRLAVEETRLGIPLLFGYDVIHGYRTIFPIPLAEAASWDTTLAQNAARIAAREASAAGLHWTFAPMVDIARDPKWGRVMEGSGEDVALGSAMARARVRGFQGDDLADESTILACAKHFAAYGAAQAGRDYHTVDISDRVLRETYLPPFKAALDAGVATYMTSFNEVDGVPASGSRYLLTDILRDEWGFDGFVVTDYTSINEMIPHGVVADTREAAALAIKAGVDMDMQGATFHEHLVGLVNSGEVKRSSVRTAARRILGAKAALGLFEDPYRYSDTARQARYVAAPEHRQAAREAATRSMVLLKNDSKTLPLATSQRVLLAGPLVESQYDMIGAWHGDGQAKEAVSPLMGLQEVYPQLESIVTATFELDGSPSDEDRTGFQQVMAAASRADVVVLCLGEKADMSGEAASRTSLDLPGRQLELLRALAALNKPVVSVVFAGRPLVLTEVEQLSDAVLYAWWPGTEAGNALADILTGKVNPSARLPMTFPRTLGQVPLHYDMKNTGRPFDANNKYTSKYLDSPNTPLYAFGYGLGYSDIRYGELKSSSTVLRENEPLTLTIEVSNVGEVAQRETVQFYYHDLQAQRTRPVLQLLAWRQVDLAPGETKTVSIPVRAHELSYLGPDGKTATLDAGAIDLFAGPASNDLSKVGITFLSTPSTNLK